MTFDEWLTATRELQEGSFGVDYADMASNPEARAAYLRYNLLAAVDEVMEVAREIQWKPWAKKPGVYNADNVRDEVVDVIHFLGNILAACGITGDELSAAYAAKIAENRRRMEDPSHEPRLGKEA